MPMPQFDKARLLGAYCAYDVERWAGPLDAAHLRASDNRPDPTRPRWIRLCRFRARYYATKDIHTASRSSVPMTVLRLVSAAIACSAQRLWLSYVAPISCFIAAAFPFRAHSQNEQINATLICAIISDAFGCQRGTETVTVLIRIL